MAVDRQRLAEALAYEEQKRRMMESVPTVGSLPPAQPARRSLRTDLENLSSGIGQGIVNQMEGVKGLITDPVGTVKGAYEGVKGIVRDPSVLADALRYTADKAMSGPLGAGEVVGEMLGPMRGKPPMAEIDVYHGSPHRFEEFDASKIGTGEGAQAFGHGIYVAESPNVAKSYKTVGSDAAHKRVTSGMTPMEEYAFDLATQGVVGEDLFSAMSRKYGKSLTTDKDFDAFDAAIKQAEKNKGNLYTADLPDEMVDRMLDWDKPLSEQPELTKYLENLTEMKTLKARGKDISNLTGKQFYDLIADSRSHWRRDASAGLAEIGIPGIKYMDEGSRGYVVDLFHKGKPYAEHLGEKYPTLQSAQQRIAEAKAEGFEPKLGTRGTRNFVVFPGEEKKVKILKRE